MRRVYSAIIIAAAGLSATYAPAAVVTTATSAGGLDGTLRFNAATTPLDVVATNGVLVKTANATTAETSLNDRVGFLRFSAATLEPTLNYAAVQLQTLAASTNQYVNQTIYLYGIPDASATESFSSAMTAGGATGFAYGTGANSVLSPRDATDTTINRINDSLLTPLATVVVGATATTANSVLTFSSIDNPALLAFLQANTNSVVSFALSTTPGSDMFTPGFYTSRTTATGVLIPTLLTNANVPEPTAITTIAGGAVVALRRRRSV